MGKIHKITKNGQTIYPATTTDAVAHPTLKVPVSKLIGEINVSNLFPTGGTNGTNKYTLESAIAKIPTDLRIVGIKCSFLSDAGVVEEWVYQGGTFTNTDSWIECGGRKLTELETNLGIYSYEDGYINASGEIGDVASLQFTGSSNWKSLILKCNDGDTFAITGTGGSLNSPLFAFVDSQNKIVEKATAYQTANKLIKTASVAGKFIVNFSTTQDYRLEKISKEYIELESELDTIVADLKEGKYSKSPDIPSLTLGIDDANKLGYYVNKNDGKLVENSDWNTLEYLEIGSNAKILVKADSGVNAGLAFYDSDKTFISGTTSYNIDGTEIISPSNAIYLSIGFSKTKDLQNKQSISYTNKKILYQIQEFIDNNEYEVDHNIRNTSSVHSSRINVLFVGNSFSRDAVVYVPEMLKSLGITNFTIGILYLAGARLQHHVSRDGEQCYVYNKYNGETDDGWETISSGYTLQQGCEDEDWNVVVLHQASVVSGHKDYDTTVAPYLETLMDKIYNYLINSEKFIGNLQFAWMATPAYAENYEDSNYDSSDEMYDDIVKNAMKIMGNYQFSFWIPECTAIQNARQTSLNEIGEIGGLAYDVHLQEGIGRQTACYMSLYSLFGVYPLGNKIRITENSILEPHGDAVGSTDDNCYIAQKCIIDAIKTHT